jgi:hypothetical protein
MDANLISFGEKTEYCCIATINPARPMGHLSSFVVGKLTSVNRRATLFHVGD